MAFGFRPGYGEKFIIENLDVSFSREHGNSDCELTQWLNSSKKRQEESEGRAEARCEIPQQRGSGNMVT